MSTSEREPKVEAQLGSKDEGAGPTVEPVAQASLTAEPAPDGIIDRLPNADGQEMVLSKRGDAWEIQIDGQLAMASDVRRSERSLAELALAPLAPRDDISVLLVGLGMGHTLRAVLDQPGVTRVDVVEISPAMVEWNRRYFGSLNGDVLLDERVHLHNGDILGLLKEISYSPIQEVADGWLAILLDTDNGPGWVTRAANSALYTDEGLARLEAALRHGGVLGIWSAERDLEFYRRMHARFTNAGELAVPVDVGGKSSLDYIYRGRRRPAPQGSGKMAKA